MSITAIKERPILMDAEDIRAILAERKTQMRRVVKDVPKQIARILASACPEHWLPQWDNHVPAGVVRGVNRDTSFTTNALPIRCPYGRPGDRLWIRETWADNGQSGLHSSDPDRGTVYRATDPEWSEMDGWRWRSPMHMSRVASRLTLEITDVRVERLHDISVEDVFAEFPPGMVCGRYQCRPCNGQGRNITWPRKCPHCDGTGDAPTAHMAAHWDSLNAKRPGCSWKSNSFVWVIDFKEIS